MIRRPPRSTPKPSSAASDVYKRQILPEVEHVDFILVKAGQKVAVEVAVIITGEPQPGLIVNHDLIAVPVLAPVADIPEQVEVSVEGLEVGANVLVSDIKFPGDVEPDIDTDTLVASIVLPDEEPEEPEVEEESEEAEGEATEEAAE